MSLAISLAVGTVYGLYTFGAIGSSHLKYCLSSQSSYYPYDYHLQSEMMAFLAVNGNENVTSKFDTIIQYGFISNLIFIMFQIYKMSKAPKEKKGISFALLCLEGIVAAIWITQFILLIVYRFSHTGKVCSGDYSADSMIVDDLAKADEKYNIYYMRSEGDFFYFYVLCCGLAAIAFVLFACCTGSILFFAGSFGALQFA